MPYPLIISQLALYKHITMPHLNQRNFLERRSNGSYRKWGISIGVAMHSHVSQLIGLVLECLQEEAESGLQPRMTCRHAYYQSPSYIYIYRWRLLRQVVFGYTLLFSSHVRLYKPFFWYSELVQESQPISINYFSQSYLYYNPEFFILQFLCLCSIFFLSFSFFFVTSCIYYIYICHFTLFLLISLSPFW